jgi:hypothetical protein
MASTPVITSPADNSTQSLPFDMVGTGTVNALVEVRDDAGYLLPATLNPVTVDGAGDWTIHVTSLTGSGTGNKWYAAAGGTVAVVGPAIGSVTSGVATGLTHTLTPASIPSGAVVVLLFSCWDPPTGVPTSANLTFAQRASSTGTGQAYIFTAVAGSALTNEAISVVTASERSAVSVVVLTNANTSALTNVATSTGTSNSASVAVTAVGAASFVLAVVSGTGATASAGADTTSLYAPASPNLNFHGRNTTAGTGSITVTGSLTASVTWRMAAIEIQ